MQENLPYNDYSSWMKLHFPYKVQKISIDAGFTCPNRDGRISRGGCTFCDNQTFNPSYCDSHKSVREQLEEGKAFFARKYPEMKYLAYFQAYSNTYAPLSSLKALYEEALSVDDVVGLVVGTRPDCMTPSILSLLSELEITWNLKPSGTLKPFLAVEYGVESVYDEVLAAVNRGHTFAQSKKAIEMTHDAGILCGAHVILGLPGETEEMIIASAKEISALPIDFLKIHQLQIIRGTALAKEWENSKLTTHNSKPTTHNSKPAIQVFELDEYISLLARYIENLRPDLILERFVSQSPAELLIAPRWGLKNHEFTHKLVKFMTENNMKQGKETFL